MKRWGVWALVGGGAVALGVSALALGYALSAPQVAVTPENVEAATWACADEDSQRHDPVADEEEWNEVVITSYRWCSLLHDDDLVREYADVLDDYRS